jgi:exopolyphosphatase / guanosine-5'-triphosphate,3'-diphosphate pyrophosphatase
MTQTGFPGIIISPSKPVFHHFFLRLGRSPWASSFHNRLELKGEVWYRFSKTIAFSDAAKLEKLASIDIGSNTLRLLIAEKTAHGFQPLYRDREIVRLGGEFYPRRLLQPSAMDKAVRVLKRFKTRSDQEGAFRIKALGTGVLREAENRLIFLERIKQEAGVTVRIVSGQEEALLMARGVLSGITLAEGETVVFDMGGGSTEFVRGPGEPGSGAVSLPLGVVTLTERFLLSDPPGIPEQQALRDFGRTILRENLGRNDKIQNLIGTAGTVTTLAAMALKMTAYDPALIHGLILTRKGLEELAGQIFSLPLAERILLPGLEKGRADLVAAGVLMVLEIMDYFSRENLTVSDTGLLEGIILAEDSGFQG